MSYRVLQVNLNRCKDAQDLLLQYITELDIDICLVSEPAWIPSIRGWYNSLDNNALIYAQPDLKAKIIQDRFFVTITSTSFSFALTSCYISPNVRLPMYIEFLEHLKDLIRHVNGPIIIDGDFNAHNCF